LRGFHKKRWVELDESTGLARILPPGAGEVQATATKKASSHLIGGGAPENPETQSFSPLAVSGSIRICQTLEDRGAPVEKPELHSSPRSTKSRIAPCE
jgi:hypothetical protein